MSEVHSGPMPLAPQCFSKASETEALRLEPQSIDREDFCLDDHPGLQSRKRSIRKPRSVVRTQIERNPPQSKSRFKGEEDEFGHRP